MILSRKLYDRIASQLYQGKVIIIYGARRVGKTTLSKKILENEVAKGKRIKYLNAELLSISQGLSTTNEVELKHYIGDVDLIVIDEAQHIKNIGLVLKILVDTYPEIQVIATGSSSFDLVNKVGEPLTGRTRHFILYPFSIMEISSDLFNVRANLEKSLVYGLYPSVFILDQENAHVELEEITSGYLYKDILEFESIKHSDKLIKLLQLLAFQIGNEVSYNELGTTLEIDRATVEKYIDLLEKCFVIFRLKALSRNTRKEISKSIKIYFYDVGIRNCLIRNYNTVDFRNDIGELWENFCIVERMKRNQFEAYSPNVYFWRNYNRQEVDYIEEYNGKLYGFEFKWNEKAKNKKPSVFLESYEEASITKIDKVNFVSSFL